ncbi:hypothetical protein BAZSYMB_SCAFFOLD00048_4 [Bathymodiolus azoricus thioautotrophic gill symbiont]|uniref:Uncharacterized protein n=1 Tax=Bathymodiolus azoricus thioautotrophic gill symbiont TaxID=235205 RepID=A0A1H6KHD2_9GAMM|nr:hypothetical protein BAZSYMB_SCAFFOLD00048_4 [Bathymodiolus azoricus thioautotrophic gill symbiont]
MSFIISFFYTFAQCINKCLNYTVLLHRLDRQIFDANIIGVLHEIIGVPHE